MLDEPGPGEPGTPPADDRVPDGAPGPIPAFPPPPPPPPPPGYTPWGQGPPSYPGAYPTPGYGPPGYGPPGYGPPASPFASYPARLGAWLIDWVITSVIGAVVLLPIHAVRRDNSVIINGTHTTRFAFHVSSQGFLLSALIVIIYGTAFIGSRRGQTLGMMVTNAKAVDAMSGGPIGFARAMGRAVFEYVLIFLLFIPWVVDMLFPLWDNRRQTLHDKVTNTVVIKV